MIENVQVLFHSSIRINKNKIIYIDPFKINENVGDADYIFMAVKQYDLELVIEKIKKNLKVNQTIVFLQNGMGHLKYVKEIPFNPIVFGVVEHGALKINDFTYSGASSKNKMQCAKFIPNITAGFVLDTKCKIKTVSKNYFDKDNTQTKPVKNACGFIVYNSKNSKGIIGLDLFSIVFTRSNIR